MAYPIGTRVMTQYGPGTVKGHDKINGSNGKPRNLVALDEREYPDLEFDHTLGDRLVTPIVGEEGKRG